MNNNRPADYQNASAGNGARRRLAIIGSGALGLYYGGLLARREDQLGLETHFHVRTGLSDVRSRGIRVHSVNGDFVLPEVRAWGNTREMPPADIVLIGLKTTANSHYEELISPVYQSGKTVICCLQNGIGNEDQLAEIFDPGAVCGGVAFLCSNREAPGVIHHTDYGHIQLAAFASRAAWFAVEEIADLFRAAGVQCQTNENYYEMRWQKQVWNVPFNGLSTLFDCPVDELLAMPGMVERVRALMAEVIELGRAISRWRAPELDWKIDKQKLIADQVAKTLTMGDYHPSMLLDARAGRPLELDSIIGACVEQARQLSERTGREVAIPEITRLYRELRERFPA